MVGRRIGDVPHWVSWRFTRAGASPPPLQEDRCVASPVDRWSGIAWRSDGSRADLNWTRVRIDDCEDSFQPSGTAHLGTWTSTGCVEETFAPDHAAIDASDGSMRIDRSRWPVTVTFHGWSRWMAESRCTRADGSVEQRFVEAGAQWTQDAAVFLDGDRFAGSALVSPRAQDVQGWAAHELPAARPPSP